MTTLHDAARMAIDAISDLKGYRDDIDEAIEAAHGIGGSNG